jgi:EmrB/QacA subfamily drug resistance transporter
VNRFALAQQRHILIVATLAAFMTPFMGSSINVALPSIGDELGMDAVLLTWVATAYLMAAAASLLPLGRLADIRGRKKIFTIGIVSFSAASLLCAVSTTAAQLIAFRIIQGVGAAMIFGTAVAILSSVFPPGQRGRALGINVAAVYLGLSLGPFIGGFLTEQLGWRSIFLINVPLGLLVFVLVQWKVEDEWASAQGEAFDGAGSLIYGLTLVGIMYGFSRLPDAAGGWLILLGLLALVSFVVWETKVASPVLDVKLFRHNTVFAFSNLAALIHYSATFAVAFLLSLYLQYVRGLSPQNAGLILVAQPVVQATLSPMAGRLSDHFEPRWLASAGMTLTAGGLWAFTWLDPQSPILLIVVILALLGMGYALFSSPNTNAVMSSVENRYYGVASATVATMRQVGMMLSMGVVMLLLAVYLGRAEVTPDNHDLFLKSVRTAFVVFSCSCLVGVAASIARGRLR